MDWVRLCESATDRQQCAAENETRTRLVCVWRCTTAKLYTARGSHSTAHFGLQQRQRQTVGYTRTAVLSSTLSLALNASLRHTARTSRDDNTTTNKQRILQQQQCKARITPRPITNYVRVSISHPSLVINRPALSSLSTHRGATLLRSGKVLTPFTPQSSHVVSCRYFSCCSGCCSHSNCSASRQSHLSHSGSSSTEEATTAHSRQ